MQAPRKKFKPGYPPKKDNNESHLRKVEYYTKILASIISTAGITIAVVQLYMGVNQYKENLERDFRKNYYSEQVKVYEELLNRSSNIVYYNGGINDSVFGVRCNEFEIFYRSKLDLFQDDSVSILSGNFRHVLNKYKTDNCSRSELKSALEDLAVGCRRSIQRTWGVNIKNLIDR